MKLDGKLKINFKNSKGSFLPDFHDVRLYSLFRSCSKIIGYFQCAWLLIC